MVVVQLLPVINWLEVYSSVRNVVRKRMSDDEAPISSVISLSGRMKRFCFSSMGHRTKRVFQWSGKMGERF